MDPYAYREHARKPGTFTGGLVEGWTPLYRNEFRGVTEDGTLREGLYPLEPAEPGEEAPVEAMVAAANDLLAVLDDDGRKRISFAVDAVEWQTWANPEFLQFDTGLRLDLQPAEVREKALALMRRLALPRGLRAGPRDDADQRLPRRGRRPRDRPQRVQLQHRPLRRARPARARGAGSCSATTARSTAWWSRAAWSSRRSSSAPSPTRSTPARTPACADVFADRIELGPALMAALPDEQRRAAVVYEQMVDPAMPPGRVHPGDERHLAGAFQDNRVIPFEGVRVAEMPAEAQRLGAADRRVVRPPAARGPARRPACARSRRTWTRPGSPGSAGHEPGRRLLLPAAVARRHRRARPPLRRLPRLRHPEAVPHPHGAAHAARQRLRPGLGPAVAGAERHDLRTVRTAAGRRRGGVVVRRSPAAGSSSARMPGGRLTRVTPLGVVTVRTPSGVMT